MWEMAFQIRTDLALEARESAEEASGDLRGVRVDEYDLEASDIHVTKVVIESANGATALGKPLGTYITLEAPAMTEPDEDYHKEISEEIARQLWALLPDMTKEQSILVVGLGNRDVTADSLGPRVTDNLLITRQVLKEFGAAAYNREKMHLVSAVVPGVMAATGMETAEIIRGVAGQTKPDAVVLIDALAARSTRRLNRTIQITNTGIHPGSGVGNHRDAITAQTIDVPVVIAIGIPTVVDAQTIVNDAIGKWNAGGHSAGEREAPELLPELANFYVTGKDVDEIVKRLSYTISEGLNRAFERFGEA
ncbi:MAG: GPR endopeptidase [Clostridium sp.]|nr:GPR endopeptidase [Clostridium sp.]